MFEMISSLLFFHPSFIIQGLFSSEYAGTRRAEFRTSSGPRLSEMYLKSLDSSLTQRLGIV